MIRPGIKRLFHLATGRRGRAGRDVDEEIRLHLDMRREQLERGGLSRDAAVAEAERRFGSLREAQRELQYHAQQRERTMQVREWLAALRQDISYAVRGLKREPLFAMFVVVTFALGIGANAAMFGVLDRLLLQGPKYITNASSVMRVYEHEKDNGTGEFTGDTFGYVMYAQLKQNAHSFDGVAAYSAGAHQQTVMGRGEDAQLIKLGQATADLFPTLGTKAALGRFFSADEDKVSGAERVTVIGYGLWQRAFGGDSAVLGKMITLGNIQYAIVGVAPKGFTGPQLSSVDAWIPMGLHTTVSTGSEDWSKTWHAQWLNIITRLKPGVTRQQASLDATAVFQHGYTGGDTQDGAADILVAPLSYNEDGKESTDISVSRWLVGVAFIVLLIACSNVANLLLARAMRRRREVAVRLALGAGRRRLIQLFLTESIILSALGGAAGLAVAWITGQLMRTVLLTNIEWTSSPVDGRVLAVTAIIALGVGVIVGLVPALRSSRPNLTGALKAGVREGGMHGTKLRATLTVAQAALSVVLLTGAGLFVHSLSNIEKLDLGIQPNRMLLVSPRWPSGVAVTSEAQIAERARRAQLYLDALSAIRKLPDVERAALSVGLPFQSSYSQALRVTGWDSIPKIKGGFPQISAVGSDYFPTVGTKILQGRAFSESDRPGSEPVVLVSDQMAKVLWPGKSAIGECLYTSPSKDSLTVCSRIVGITADVHRFRLVEATGMHYYVPMGQEKGIGGTTLIVRPRSEAAGTIAEVRQLMLKIDPSILFVNAKIMQGDVDPQIGPWRLGASVFGLMGALALIVAAVGLYSVMSYLVAQRTHELGVRIALGAQGRDIISLVLRSSVGMALLGVVIGIALSLLAGRFIQPLLFNISAHDVTVLASVSLVLMAIAILASLVPALRAKGTDPMEALRTD